MAAWLESCTISLVALYSRARGFALRVFHRAGDHRLSPSAAAVAFFAFLAFIPTLAALVMIYGLVFDPGDVSAQVALLERVAPREVVVLLSTEAERVTGSAPGTLGLGLAGGLLLAIWSSSKGTRALIDAIDVIHNEQERHSWIQLYLLSLAFTVSVLVGLALAIFLLVTLPLLAPYLPHQLGPVVVILRWVVLFALVVFGIAGFYRFAPRNPRRGRLITPGTLAAATMWLAVSYLFQLYVDRISRLSASFGSVSSVAVFLLWLYLSVLVVLVGAEIDRVRRRSRKSE